MSGALSVPSRIRANPIAWASDAKAQIAACGDVGQVKEMAALAKAALAYLNEKLGRYSEEARVVGEVEWLTRRRIGELLPAKGKGGRGRKTVTGGHSSERKAAERNRALADLPQEDADAYLAEQREAGKPPSVAGALKRRKQEKPEPVEVGDWGAAKRTTSKTASMIAKAISHVVDHMEDGPERLNRTYRKIHKHLAEAHRVASAFELEAGRKSK